MPKNPNAYTLHDGDAEIVGQVQAGSIAVADRVIQQINNKLAIDGSFVLREADKNAINGYAGLDANGKLLASVVPTIGISTVSVVANQAAQLALSAQEGDVVVRSDESKTYIHNGGTAGTMSDWTYLQSVADLVQSVAGKTGAVTLVKADITDLQDALDAKANASHTHTASAITDLGTAATKNVAATGDASSTEVVKGDDTRLTNSRTPTVHTHAIADVVGLQDALDGKSSTGHTHSIANVTDLQTALDGKASTTHSHSISDVTNLQTSLDGKASTTHSHAISDVTNLQTSLDGKAATSHTHSLSAITDAGTAAGYNAPVTGDAGTSQVVLGSDTRLTNARTPTAHKTTHATGGTDAIAPSDIGAVATTAFQRKTTTANVTVAAGAEVSVDLSLATAFTLWKVTSDKAARIRLYSTASDRTTDTSRAEGTAPSAGVGLITEIITTDTLLSLPMSPPQQGASLETTPSSTIKALVKNKSASADLELTFIFTPAEV